jgi:hypothetical protein
MPKGGCFAFVAAVVVACALWAKPGIVHLRDGSDVAGEVDDSDPAQVVVTIHGVQQTLPRESVDSVEYPGPPDEEFAGRMAKLSPNDVAGRLAISHWALGIRRFDLARRAAADALAIDPTNPAIRELLQTITYQAALTTGVSDPAEQVDIAAAAQTQPATQMTRVTPLNRQYLSADQINQIRQAELKLDETVPVAFDHDVRRRFLETGAAVGSDFYPLTETEQAREILGKGDPSFAHDLRITADPAAIMEFRTHVYTMVLGGCALSGCHNAATPAGATSRAAGFALFTGSESPAATYTNFYLLQSYVAAGRNGAPQRQMIDRPYPEKSLLVQYGLPQAIADFPHPPVPDFVPIFSGRNDPRYESVMRWIGEVLKPDGGMYRGLAYEPPWRRAAGTEPASRP